MNRAFTAIPAIATIVGFVLSPPYTLPRLHCSPWPSAQGTWDPMYLGSKCLRPCTLDHFKSLFSRGLYDNDNDNDNNASVECPDSLVAGTIDLVLDKSRQPRRFPADPKTLKGLEAVISIMEGRQNRERPRSPI